jgi:hypothetical protein
VSVPYSSDVYQAVVPGGQVTFLQMFETFYGSGFPQIVSGVTITITPAQGGTAVLGPTGTGVVTPDQATYTYSWNCPIGTPPGDYSVVLAGTGPNGAITYTQAVVVASPPRPSPMPGVYASYPQYQEWSGDTWTPASLVSTALRRASEVLDMYLIGAVYPVDADSMPTDAGVIDVFMRATCAQCQHILANNDPAWVKSQYSSVNMGGVTQTRAASAQNQAFPPLAPMAAVILRTAGVLPGAPLVSW